MSTLELDPLESPIGDIKWLQSKTNWPHDKICRLARHRLIPGSFQAQPGTPGSIWQFRKAKTLAWLQQLETPEKKLIRRARAPRRTRKAEVPAK